MANRLCVCADPVDFRALISQGSGIAVDDLEYYKVSGSFPKYNVYTLSVHSNTMWTDKQILTDDIELSRSGDMFFYR